MRMKGWHIACNRGAGEQANVVSCLTACLFQFFPCLQRGASQAGSAYQQGAALVQLCHAKFRVESNHPKLVFYVCFCKLPIRSSSCFFTTSADSAILKPCCVVRHAVPRQQVRSCTLDTKAWEPAVMGLFQHIGNEFANRVWEGGLAPSGPSRPSSGSNRGPDGGKVRGALSTLPCLASLHFIGCCEVARQGQACWLPIAASGICAPLNLPLTSPQLPFGLDQLHLCSSTPGTPVRMRTARMMRP